MYHTSCKRTRKRSTHQPALDMRARLLCPLLLALPLIIPLSVNAQPSGDLNIQIGAIDAALGGTNV